MESNIIDVDISILRKLYTTLEEKMAKVVKELEIERAKVAKLEEELSKYSVNPGAGDGLQNADPNPLLLETVLQQLSGYLDHNTKASCRLVCQKWKEIITPKFRSQSKLTLDFSSYVDKEIDNMTLKLSSSFPESDFEERIRIPPCVDLKFKPSKHHRGTRTFLNRFKTFGKYIQKLTLRTTVTFSRTDQVSKDLFLDILNCCNNLAVLVIPCPSIEPLNPDILFPQINALQIGEERDIQEWNPEVYLVSAINSLLRSTPNLKILKLTTCQTEGDILSCLNTCRDTGYFETLVELVLSNSFVTTESLTTLSQCQFKCLETLNLETQGDVILDFQAAAALTTLLANLSLFLKDLTLGMKILNEEEEEGVSLTIASIPRIESLKRFSFIGKMIPEQGSLNEFMEKFPKLQTLLLGQYFWNEFEEYGAADQLFPENLAEGLQFLTLRYIWIPNLPMKKYETRENYSPLEIIARSCPEVQNLTVGLNFDRVNFNWDDDIETHFETAISDLSYMLQLSALCIAFKGVTTSQFNDCVSTMFNDKFHGLKTLSFLSFDDECKINLDKETVKEGFENPLSLADLTFRNFSIKATEKQEIFETLKLANLNSGFQQDWTWATNRIDTY